MIVRVGCGSCMVLCMFSLSVGFGLGQEVAWLSGLGLCLGLVGQSCGFKLLGGFDLANCVVVGVGCDHVWCYGCVHNMFTLGLNKCGFDVWLEVVFGLVCQSCGSHMLVGFPLANFVVVWLDGAEPLVWLCVSLCDCML